MKWPFPLPYLTVSYYSVNVLAADAELRAAAAAIEAAKVEAEEIVNLTSSQNDIQAASLPLPGETNNDVETEKDMPDTICTY